MFFYMLLGKEYNLIMSRSSSLLFMSSALDMSEVNSSPKTHLNIRGNLWDSHSWRAQSKLRLPSTTHSQQQLRP